MTLKNAELSDLVEEGKQAALDRDKMKADVERAKEELTVTRGEYLTIKKEKDKMQAIIDRQAEQVQEQRAEIERQSQLLSDKSEPP